MRALEPAVGPVPAAGAVPLRERVPVPFFDGAVLHSERAGRVTTTVVALAGGLLHGWVGDQPPPEVVRDMALVDVVGVFERPIWADIGLNEPEWVLSVTKCARVGNLPDDPIHLLTALGLSDEAASLSRARNLASEAGLDVMMRVAKASVAGLSALMVAGPWNWGATPSELRVMRVDEAINARGVPVDVELMRALYEVEGRVRLELLSRPGVDGVDVRRPSDVERHLRALRRWRGQYVEERVAELLEARDCLGRNTRSKLVRLLAGTAADGRVRNAFTYAAGRTGRWGSGLFHNLAKGSSVDRVRAMGAVRARSTTMLGDVAAEAGVPTHEVLASLLRSVVAAPRGRHLICADFSSIEVRVLFWLAKDSEVLIDIAAGKDPYVSLAAMLFGIPAREVGREQRSFAKPVFLGCMFGMGPETLLGYVDAFGVSWEAFGFDAEEVVHTWRRMHPSVAGPSVTVQALGRVGERPNLVA